MGYWPAAVSADSITASVPSSTALATSLTSARVGVGQQLAVIQRAFSAVAVFFTGHTGFERPEATQLAFNRHADRVRHL